MKSLTLTAIKAELHSFMLGNLSTQTVNLSPRKSIRLLRKKSIRNSFISSSPKKNYTPSVETLHPKLEYFASEKANPTPTMAIQTSTQVSPMKNTPKSMEKSTPEKKIDILGRTPMSWVKKETHSGSVKIIMETTGRVGRRKRGPSTRLQAQIRTFRDLTGDSSTG